MYILNSFPALSWIPKSECCSASLQTDVVTKISPFVFCDTPKWPEIHQASSVVL